MRPEDRVLAGLKAVVEHSGWADLEVFLQMQVDAARLLLERQVETVEVYRLQGRIAAYRLLLSIPAAIRKLEEKPPEERPVG